MTMGEAKGRVSDALDGVAGKAVNAAAIAVILGLSGWAVKTTGDHSVDLAGIRSDVQNLILTVQNHNAAIDSQMSTIVREHNEISIRVTRLQDAEEMRQRWERRPPGP